MAVFSSIINNKLFPYYFYLLSILLLISNFIFNEIGVLNDIEYLEVLKILAIFKISGIGIFFLVKFENIFNPYSLLVFNFLLFIFSRILMDLFGLGEFGEDATFSYQSFSVETQIKTITQIFLSLNGFFLAFLICYKDNYLKKGNQNFFIAESLFLRNETLLFFLLCLVFLVLISFKLKVFFFVINDGYSALQSGGFGGKPIEIFISEGFFWFLSSTLR